MIDDLKAMAIFAETIKRGSFRAAAKSLKLSPSVVSYQISQLEERLGTALIYRSTRKLANTAEGEILYKYAVEMLDKAQLGLRNVSGRDVATGRLTLTLPLSMTGDVITEMIAEFSKENPGIDLHCIYSDHRYDLIENGIDIAFSLGSLPDSNLNVKKLVEKRRTLVCSPQYLKKHPMPTVPDDLAGWNWIQHDLLPGNRTLIKGKKKYLINLNGNISANSAEAMVKFAIYGLGLCTASHWLIREELKDGRLIHVLPDWQVETIPFYAVWHGNISKCSNSRRLLDYLKDYGKDLPKP